MQLSWVDIEKKLEESIKHIAKDNPEVSWAEFMLKLQIAVPDVVAAYEAVFDGHYANFSHLNASNQLTRKVIELLINLAVYVQFSNGNVDHQTMHGVWHVLLRYFIDEDFITVWPAVTDISNLLTMLNRKLSLMTSSTQPDARQVLNDVKKIITNRTKLKIKPYGV